METVSFRELAAVVKYGLFFWNSTWLHLVCGNSNQRIKTKDYTELLHILSPVN